MNIKEAVKILKKEIEPKENRIAMELDIQAIETVLKELEDTQRDNFNLRSYLAQQGLINDYIKYRKEGNKNANIK